MKLFGGKKTDKPTAEPAGSGNSREQFLDKLSAFLNRGGWKKYRKLLVVIGCIVLAALLVIIGYSIWEKPPEVSGEGLNIVETPKPAVSEVPLATPQPPEETAEPEETPEPSPEPTPAPNERKDGCYTFLLLAYDQLGANTDTIIVGRMDTENAAMDLVNIPRDSLVNVSWGVKKVNTILASERNDIDRFIAHLGGVIGFTVDCYALVDINAVQKLVDCIGGVYYNVPRDMDYDDPTQDLHIHIAKGYQLLFGEDAVKVLRFRVGNDGTGYVNGDLGRIATQQDFLLSIADQMLTLGNIPNIDKAIEVFEESVKTDLSANNIAFFLHEFLKLDKENIRFHTLTGEGVNIRGGSYYALNVDDLVDIINIGLNPYYQEVTADNLDVLRKAEDGTIVSTSGEVIPTTSFYDFSTYVAPTVAAAPDAEESE